MAQKVITVTGSATLDKESRFAVFDFPVVSDALSDGFEVKEVHQSALPNTAGGGANWFIITFVLEKPNAPAA